ncbi:NAD(P)-dependent oxidoreductase [Kibdelosporangium persicum]|uniref:Nucleoside-diphosphate-sugar epimerase n=1 Tax=Kibdelosporangium persicum TaxID=2698649 RepID=A0ABX2FJX3_9PSEU|nr:NAD(P)-dependent oxidoreductase [Kibdelosporangium persicum]NRN71135.1 Nucleoside-diphosphate-sugar epimerase [Kibdelosporangium persicum]
MTILLTGVTGLVGARLLPRLVDAGIDCRALVRPGRSVPDGVAAVEGDVLDPQSLARAVDGVSAIVHLAAVLRTPDPARIEEVNVRGTRNLIAAAQEGAPLARFVMASTGLVYGPGLDRPAREKDPAEAPMPYPVSKVKAEKALRESGLNWSVLRLAFVYGDADDHLRSAPALLGNWNWHPAQRLSLVHHRDIATAVLLALTGAMDGRVVNIGDESPTSVYEIAGIVGADYQASAEPLTDPWMGQMDVTLARQLGFRPSVPTVYQAAREGAL